MFDLPVANRCLGGTTYGITLLCPILPDSGEVSPRAELARVLAEMPTGADSPLARVGVTHLARWVIVGNLPFEGPPGLPDPLQSAYLLFTANIDGDLDTYVDQMGTLIPETVETVWRYCVAFPGVSSQSDLRAYMRRCQIPTTFLFGAYPSASVQTVLRALVTQQALARFVADHASLRGAELQQAFSQFRRQLSSMPVPSPGTSF